MNEIERKLAQIDPSERVLLLPHCLRPTEICKGKYSRQGLECSGCELDCSVNRLRKAAIRLGYKGVCIAPGGRLAIRFIEEKKPRGIVAIACQKELEEGIHGVQEINTDPELVPPMVVIPLSTDGCVDTEVDEELALKMIALGCSPEMVKEVVG